MAVLTERMYDLAVPHDRASYPLTPLITAKNTGRSAIGGVSLAGFIRDGPGIPANVMRVLGSYALVYVLHGGGTYQDALRGRLRVQAGDLIVVLPDVPHHYGPPPGKVWNEFYVIFDGPVFDAWRAAGLLSRTGPQGRLGPLEYWRERLETAAGTLDDTGPAAGLASACRLQQFLADVLVTDSREQEWIARAKATLDTAALRATTPRVHTSRVTAPRVAAEHADPTADDPVRAAARTARLPYDSFRKRFAREVGISPGRYYSARIIDHACRRLAGTAAIADVAAACGFCDAFHFSKRFKQHIGVSPAEFRRQLQGGDSREAASDEDDHRGVGPTTPTTKQMVLLLDR